MARVSGGLVVTGVEQLDRQLRAITAEDGPKSINKAFRQASRKAVKEIVKPAVLELIPWETGFLESQLVVRAIPRSRSRVGYYVGFPDPLFQGDTFYGGFIEFGFDSRVGVRVEADSYLRRALYPNTDQVMQQVLQEMKVWANMRNNGI